MNHWQRNNPYHQHTIQRSITFEGRGVHSGQCVVMTLQPAPADSGYVFERQDVAADKSEVAARWHQVTDTRLCTKVSNGFGVSVATIEHLMAALNASGVDNCRILIDGPEVPIMDGSAEPFIRKIQQTGLAEQRVTRRALIITNPVWVREGEKFAGFVPFPQPWFDISIDFPSQVIGKQSLSVPLDSHFFTAEIAKARTFGFESQIATLQQLGLARGGSLNNAILVSGDTVVNPEGLRYEDEFVRHKLLDAIGDFALVGMPIYGRFVGHCSGHELNNRLLKRLLWHSESSIVTSVLEAAERWSQYVVDDSYELLDAAV